MERERMDREGGEERSEVGDTSSVPEGGWSSPPTWTRLIPLRTQKDTRRFLRAILQDFVEKVDIEKSGLLDALMVVGVITERDAESLGGSHLPTSSEKARRLWSILFDIDHVTFVKKALPLLCEDYQHIIPEMFWLPQGACWSHGEVTQSPAESCVRCAIRRRIRPTDVGDLLMTAGLITDGTHRDIFNSYRSRSTNWSKIFGAFKKLAGRDVSSHVARMRKLMARHSLPVPYNLPRVMTQGFPCSCPSSKKTGLCIPDCLGDPSSGSDSSLPSVHSLPDSEDCPYSSSLSVPSDYNHSDSSGSDTYQLSDHYSETSLEQVVSFNAQNTPFRDTNDDLSQCEHSDPSSEHSETELKRVVSIPAVNTPFPSERTAESNAAQDRLEETELKRTGCGFAGEDEPPAYSRYAESEGQVPLLPCETNYSEIHRAWSSEMIPEDSRKSVSNTSEEPSVLDTWRQDRNQFLPATANEEERSRNWNPQMSGPEIRHWSTPASGVPMIYPYPSRPSGERENGGFEKARQEEASIITVEKSDICAASLPWPESEMMKSDHSFTVNNGNNACGILLFCGLMLAPVLLLFFSVYFQNFALHVAGTAFFVLLFFLAVLVRNLHR